MKAYSIQVTAAAIATAVIARLISDQEDERKGI